MSGDIANLLDSVLSPDGSAVVLRAMVMERQGRAFATKHRVFIWHPGASGEPDRLPLPGITEVAISPAGRIFLTCDQEAVRRWRISNAASVGAPLMHENAHAAFSPDGRNIITWSADEAMLWDARSGETLARGLRMPVGVSRLTFSTEGDAVLAVHENGVRVWPRYFFSLLTGRSTNSATQWAELLTGMERTPDDEARPIDELDWRRRRHALERLLGIAEAPEAEPGSASSPPQGMATGNR